MALENLFFDPRALKRFREGPLGLGWMVSVNGCLGVDLCGSPYGPFMVKNYVE